MFVKQRTFTEVIDGFRLGDLQNIPVHVPWRSWGTEKARIISDLPLYHWLRYAQGTRVALPPDPESHTLTILDFNTCQQTQTLPTDRKLVQGTSNIHTILPSTTTIVYHSEPSILPRLAVFEFDVETRLPYYEIKKDLRERYGALMIDAERVIGLKIPEFPFVDTLQELHIYAI